jgi:hypothetical protein
MFGERSKMKIAKWGTLGEKHDNIVISIYSG